jgi:hypothetical protein
VVLFELTARFDIKRDLIPDENLVCYDADGRERWRAKLPPDGGYFVGVSLDGDLIVANTFGAYALWIDPATGETAANSVHEVN